MRALMVFWVVLTLGYTLGFAAWLIEGTDRADHKVQTFLSYSLGISTTLLGLMAVFISIHTITRDIRRKEIFMIATKPISRGGFLAGKVIGMMLLNLIFLSITAVIVYGVALNLPGFMENVSQDEQNRLDELVYTAREAVNPDYRDVSAEVEKWVSETVQRKIREEPENYRNNPAVVAQMRRVLAADKRKELILQQTAVAPGTTKVMHFTGVFPRDREDGYIFIRVKNDVSVNTPDLKSFGQWSVGPQDPAVHGGYSFLTHDAIRTYHEYPVPAELASPEGDLYVYFRNPLENGRSTIIFPQGTGIQVLYTRGGFTPNYLRTVAMIYMRLGFLSLLGVAAGSYLSFPVALFLVMTVYVFGSIRNFMSEALEWNAAPGVADVLEAVMSIFPNLGLYDPVPLIEKGRYVSELLMGGCFLWMVVVQGGVIILLGYLLFRYRELAQVIV